MCRVWVPTVRTDTFFRFFDRLPLPSRGGVTGIDNVPSLGAGKRSVTMSKTANDHSSFSRKYREVAQAATGLQEAVRCALSDVSVGEIGARSLARRLGIDKTLGSLAMRIAMAADPAAVLSSLPGDRAMRSLLAGFRRAEVSVPTIDAVEQASAELRRTIEALHVTPRELASIATGGMGTEAQLRHLAKMQTLHFESSVALRGEVADSQVQVWFVTHARRDRSLATLVSVDMTAGFRTIRPLGPRLVHRGVAVDRDAEAGDWQRIDGMHNPVPSLIAEASTRDLGPNAIQSRVENGGALVLADPDAHPSRSLTLSFAERLEAVGPIRGTREHRTGELSTTLGLPLRHLYFDVLFDEALPHVEPTGALFFLATKQVEYGEIAELRRFHGKITTGFVRSTNLPAASRVDASMHARMLEHGARLAGRPLGAFRCFRMHIAYPPIHSRGVVRWLLPVASRS